MNFLISWVDNTLNEAIKMAVSWSQLALIVRYLTQMSIHTGNVCLNHWANYVAQNTPCQDTALLPYIKAEWRLKIAASQEQTAEAVQSGFSKIILSFQPGQPEKLLIADLDALRGKKLYLELENASQATCETWLFLQKLVNEYDINGIIYYDAKPVDTLIRLSDIQTIITVPLEFHGDNTYGLATANALSALRAGISRISVSAGGVGNHTPLEEIWMASEYFLGYSKPIESFADYCRQIIASMDMCIPKNKAILGSEIFSHESGIHVDGITKDPQLYEAFPPEKVGLTRKLIIGKHSGSAALRYKLHKWQLSLTGEELKTLLKTVRSVATAQKAAVTDYQLRELYFKTVGQV